MNTDDTLDARASRKPPAAVPTMRIVFCGEAGPVDRAAFELDPGDNMAGRGVPDGEGISLSDDWLASRLHAVFHYNRRKNTVRVEDKNSKNGCHVNGKRVEREFLVDGDVLRLGDSFMVLRFELDDQPDEPIAALMGNAPSICDLRATIGKVGASDATVLLLGESGTGKEVVARALHEASGCAGPFIAVNMSAIPENLAESQLFGHVAGSFTGARRDHDGFFRAAEGGTIFLDEIGDLPLSQQAKLLRALEERAVTPVGSVKPLSFNARVIAATNQVLASRIQCKEFRGDLYARLAQITLKLPALRHHREDVLLLMTHHLGTKIAPLDADLVEALLLYRWPHNVRELIAVATELRVRGAGEAILDLSLVQSRLGTPVGIRAEASGMDVSDAEFDDQLADLDPNVTAVPGNRRPVPNREELEKLLVEFKGNLAHVARATGRSRMQVYRWMEKHGMNAEEYRDE